MKLDVYRKIVAADQLAALGRECRARGATVVHCHGCFDIVHPGHLRYLQFAHQQGDVLVVSLTGDDAIEKSDGMRPYVPQELRAENLAALEFVSHVVIAPGPTAEPIIEQLKPDVYIKGKEYEHSAHPGFLAEKHLVEAQGGRVIFSSGEVVFSSSVILNKLGDLLAGDGLGNGTRLAACCRRWGVDVASVSDMVSRGMAGKRIAVVGDAMLDHYVFCDATDVAGEAPILSVRPLQETTYLGGAAIIAAHLKKLGAEAHLLTTAAEDEASSDLLGRLDEMGVAHTTLATRHALPTKQRFLVDTQKLLKVDRAEAQPLDSAAERRMLGTLAEMRTSLDAVVFVDFGYGTVTPPLVEQASRMLRQHVGVLAGDVSGPRRSLLSMKGFDLLTPTERELRSVMGDFERSLPGVAMNVMKELGAANLAVTMGRKGCVLLRPREEQREQWFSTRLRSEYLPALAEHAVDPVGAGDAFLATATLAMAGGATLPQAGYIGSSAAALSVSRMGNQPITREQLMQWFARRMELQTSDAVAAVG